MPSPPRCPSRSTPLATWFLPALSQVPQDPPVCFDLHREDESHIAALLREGTVMAAVTSLAEPVTGCTARLLGLARCLPVASPEFVERHFAAGSLEQRLPEAPVIVFDRRDELQDRYVRTVTSGRAGASRFRHYVPTSEGFRDTIVAGLGWGLVPETHADPLLRSGALRNFAPEQWVDVPLYWQQWKLDVPALALVAQTIGMAAADYLRQ